MIGRRLITSRVRIVGGRWRGRNILLPDKTEIRPTPVRLRETLFNWVAPYIRKRRCLDLFAGSGALGFEAISRGAQHTTFVDAQRLVCTTLKKQIQDLDAYHQFTVVHTAAAHFLHATHASFNLIFLDPPFNKDLLEQTLNFLTQKPHLLCQDTLIYMEFPKNMAISLPQSLTVWRQTTVASVSCALLQSAGKEM